MDLSSGESKILLTGDHKIFSDFVLSLRSSKKLYKHSIFIFVLILVFLFGGSILLTFLKVTNFIIFIMGVSSLVIGSLVSQNIDKNKLKNERCPICKKTINTYRKKTGEWIVECVQCKLSASTEYSGITGNDD